MKRFPLTLSLFSTTLLTLAASSALMAGSPDSNRLAEVLDAQPEEAKARYGARHPRETLEFFELEPGMTVVEALPGGGWYSKILLPYLGGEGVLIGANYAQDMWPLFGFFSEEQIEGFKTWVTDFQADAEEWRGEDSAEVKAFVFGSMPDEMKGTADAVLFVRALHNLARFEDQGGYLSTAVQNAFDVLKPGGLVGVVQHQASDDKPDDWADGSRGYLKDDFVIKTFTDAGFKYTGQSGVNNNPKDQPGEEDLVWRLPPTLFTSRDNPELRAEMEAIGESNRMTLKFRKP